LIIVGAYAALNVTGRLTAPPIAWARAIVGGMIDVVTNVKQMKDEMSFWLKLNRVLNGVIILCSLRWFGFASMQIYSKF
jgi:type III secretory pathway component EscS